MAGIGCSGALDLFGDEIQPVKKSYRASSKNRSKNDHYPTHPSLVWQLLEKEEFPKEMIEPCCGKKSVITNILIDREFSVESYDLFYGDPESRRDYLCETRSFEGMVTNPPFSIAEKFIEKSLSVVKEKFALLLPLDYLHGYDRYLSLYEGRTPLRTVYSLVRRPLFSDSVREDGKYRTGSTSFAWFVWEIGYKGKPMIDWIDNQMYVLSKGE